MKRRESDEQKNNDNNGPFCHVKSVKNNAATTAGRKKGIPKTNRFISNATDVVKLKWGDT